MASVIIIKSTTHSVASTSHTADQLPYFPIMMCSDPADGADRDEMRGSFHGDDVFYLLGLSLLRDGSAEESEISEQLMAYVAGFCYAGYLLLFYVKTHVHCAVRN